MSEMPERSTTSATMSRRRRAVVLVVLGLLVGLGPLSTDAYVPGLPTVATDLGATTAWVQLTVTSCLVGLAIGQLVAGPLSDVVGRKRPLIAGVAVYTIAGFLCAVAPTVGVLIALRAVQGLGGAFALVIAYAYTRDLYSGRAAARAFATLLLVTGVAPIVAPLLGAGIISAAGWRWVFVALGALSALVAALTLLVLPETGRPRRARVADLRAVRSVYGALLRDRRLVGFALTNALVFAAMFAYISGAPFVLRHLFGVTTSEFSIIFAVNAVGLVVAAQISGRTPAAPITMMRAGVLGVVAGGLLLTLLTSLDAGLWPALIALFVIVSSVGLVLPNAAASALEHHADEAGAASALLGCTQFLFGGLAAPLVGLLGTDSAYPLAGVMLALGLGAAAALASVPREHAEVNA